MEGISSWVVEMRGCVISLMRVGSKEGEGLGEEAAMEEEEEAAMEEEEEAAMEEEALPGSPSVDMASVGGRVRAQDRGEEGAEEGMEAPRRSVRHMAAAVLLPGLLDRAIPACPPLTCKCRSRAPPQATRAALCRAWAWYQCPGGRPRGQAA